VWVREQPRGALTRAHYATGLAYSTVFAAQFKLMRRDVAYELSRFTRGAVRVADIATPRRGEALAQKAAS